MAELDEQSLVNIRRINRAIPGPELDDETLAYIARRVAEAPPLTTKQIATLRRIFGPVSRPIRDALSKAA